MIEEPRIIQSQTLLTAYIRIATPRDEIQDVMGPGLTELMQVLTAQGIKPSGPWFNHHLKMDPDEFDFELSVPVTKEIQPAGRVVPGVLASARVAQTIYHGSYDGLGDAWGKLHSWVEAQGFTPRADLWEYYVSGPESNPDSASWQTELNLPLTGS